MARMLAYFAMVATFVLGTEAARAEIPQVGEPMTWPTLKVWLDDPPAPNDAAGKVVVHWFCTSKVALCRDDLARLVGLREAGKKIYIIAYINGTRRDAQNLDPVRGEVGAGAVSYGRPVGILMKQMAFGAGPAAVVVDVSGKIATVQNGGDPDQLDKRDARVNELVAAIKDFTVTTEGPSGVIAPGTRFMLKITVTLAPWLSFNKKAPMDLALSLPTELTCDASRLKADQMKLEGRTLTASVGCSTPMKGSYEVRAEYRFGYDHPNGTTGLGTDATRWKFEVKP